MHGLRLKGFAEAPAVAEVVAMPEVEVKNLLDRLVDDDVASYRDGRLSGFTLTPGGRAEHARLLARELDAHGVREAVHTAYAKFLRHNGDLLSVCTAWQLREVDGESTINDHRDPAYDAGVIEQLAEVHGHVEPICAELASSLLRFTVYGPRLTDALSRIRAGDIDWFTKPMIASYHTVWFELHEDLLSTLGIERGQEVTS
jgi:hypothetical protein